MSADTAALELSHYRRILALARGGVGVDSSELYRANAAECLVMASSMIDAHNRASLLNMASAWMRLAELADKNKRTELVYETPPPQLRTIR